MVYILLFVSSLGLFRFGVTPVVEDGTLYLDFNCTNIVGDARWVTSSMLRFTPSDDWPVHRACGLQVNPKLEAWDGTKLRGLSVWPHGGRFEFVTPALEYATSVSEGNSLTPTLTHTHTVHLVTSFSS